WDYEGEHSDEPTLLNSPASAPNIYQNSRTFTSPTGRVQQQNLIRNNSSKRITTNDTIYIEDKLEKTYSL
ncbi:unnamed protein product, partial [Adineta steineri]